ncbi:MAG: helix-turn-helix transcriptional regulator [Streptomycetaceae bacterium]|nr:helix-turn-helix transcriptional regulator [Streptomycetaceae bacterium]
MAALFHPTPEQFQIENVLTALGNPTRLRAVRKLADGCEHACGTLMADVAKSTMTHHWRVLREAGLLRQDPSGRELMLTLRRTEIDARFPGLLDSVLRATEEQPATPA